MFFKNTVLAVAVCFSVAAQADVEGMNLIDLDASKSYSPLSRIVGPKGLFGVAVVFNEELGYLGESVYPKLYENRLTDDSVVHAPLYFENSSCLIYSSYGDIKATEVLENGTNISA